MYVHDGETANGYGIYNVVVHHTAGCALNSQLVPVSPTNWLSGIHQLLKQDALVLHQLYG